MYVLKVKSVRVYQLAIYKVFPLLIVNTQLDMERHWNANIDAVVAAFDTYNTLTNDTRFSNSAVLFEQYSTQAVKAVASDSTAFPNRQDNILMYVNLVCSLVGCS